MQPMPPTQQPPVQASEAGLIGTLLLEQGKQTASLAVISSNVVDIKDGLKDHENRLRLLETAKAKIYGAGITAGVLSSAIAALIIWALTHGRA